MQIYGSRITCDRNSRLFSPRRANPTSKHHNLPTNSLGAVVGGTEMALGTGPRQ